MSLDRDLLRLASKLARLEKKKPKQASLRRAVSTLYYSIFHPPSPAGLRDRVSHAFDHRRMKSVCLAFSKGRIEDLPKSLRHLVADPIEPELINIARFFVSLQEQRHSADYDLTVRLLRLDVLSLVRHARRILRGWEKVRKTDNGKVFLIALLLNDFIRV